MERMIERAKEELEMLENQHPDRFDYLKLELKSFISLLQSHLLLPNHNISSHDPLPSTSTATTQASTSMKRKRVRVKRKVEEEKEEAWESLEYTTSKKRHQKKDRVDVVLEKAHACLRKIQDLKFSLVS